MQKNYLPEEKDAFSLSVIGILRAKDTARRAASCASESCEFLPKLELPFRFLIMFHLCIFRISYKLVHKNQD